MTREPAATVDVRLLAPPHKHPTIFQTFDRLAPGEAMLIINDHDPKPLYYHMAAEMPETFDWEYLEAGPEVWRVRITKR